MTIGPENFGNGASGKEDRFATQLGQYRPGARRDTGRAIAPEVGGELVARNGSTGLESRNGSVDARSAALDAAAPIASSIAAPKLSEATMRDLNDLSDPVFSREPWGEPVTGSLVDHPLLRGLLMELPPKGTVPPPEYLDRWFEAARSILDLLYTMSARPQ